MNGLVTIQSDYSVKETIERLVTTIESKGMLVFGRIDHAANAEKQSLQLRPTELLIFGNPKVGTALMQDQQSSGIDLPLKALAWQDDAGKVWLTYNDVKWISERHNLSSKSEATIKAMEAGMNVLSNAATRK